MVLLLSRSSVTPFTSDVRRDYVNAMAIGVEDDEPDEDGDEDEA